MGCALAICLTYGLIRAITKIKKQGVISMNKKQANNEVSYRIIKIVLSAMLSEGLITETE